MPRTATATAALKVVTPTRKKKATRTCSKPPRNKYELSPTGHAKCRRCGQRIAKGQPRATLLEDEGSKFGRTPRKYHYECLTEEQRQKLPSPEKQAEQERIDNRVSALPDLKDILVKLRRRLAFEHYLKEEYLVFPNKTLDQLVLAQPTTVEDLRKVKGIGEKKLEDFGDEILKAIRNYKAVDVDIKAEDPVEIKIEDDEEEREVKIEDPVEIKEEDEIEKMSSREIGKLLRKKYKVDTTELKHEDEYAAKLREVRETHRLQRLFGNI